MMTLVAAVAYQLFLSSTFSTGDTNQLTNKIPHIRTQNRIYFKLMCIVFGTDNSNHNRLE